MKTCLCRGLAEEGVGGVESSRSRQAETATALGLRGIGAAAQAGGGLGPLLCRRGPLVAGQPGQTCPRKGFTYQPAMPPGNTGQWAGMPGLVRTSSLEGVNGRESPALPEMHQPPR